jgi:hypothetical protein
MSDYTSEQNKNIKSLLSLIVLPIIYFTIAGYHFLSLAISNAAFTLNLVVFLIISIPAWILVWGTINLEHWVRRWGMLYAIFMAIVSGFAIRTWLTNLDRLGVTGNAGLFSVVGGNALLLLLSLLALIFLYSKYPSEKVHAALAGSS